MFLKKQECFDTVSHFHLILIFAGKTRSLTISYLQYKKELILKTEVRKHTFKHYTKLENSSWHRHCRLARSFVSYKETCMIALAPG